jgi:hypothetical protein
MEAVCRERAHPAIAAAMLASVFHARLSGIPYPKLVCRAF